MRIIKAPKDHKQLFDPRIYNKNVALNTIIMELWAEKHDTKFDTASNDYIQFSISITRKLKKLFSSLCVDLNKFAKKCSNKIVYEVPAIIAEVFYVFARCSSKKGSHVSKIINKDFDQITYEETIELINNISDRLERRLCEDEESDVKCGNLEEVRQQWLRDAAYIKQVTDIKDNIHKQIQNMIEEEISKFGIYRYVDIVSVSDSYQKQSLYKTGNIPDEDIPDLEHWVDDIKPNHLLEYEESLSLITKMGLYLEESLNKWKIVVDEYISIREAIKYDHINLDLNSRFENVKPVEINCGYILEEAEMAYDAIKLQKMHPSEEFTEKELNAVKDLLDKHRK